jgi:hypothetical protein
LNFSHGRGGRQGKYSVGRESFHCCALVWGLPLLSALRQTGRQADKLDLLITARAWVPPKKRVVEGERLHKKLRFVKMGAANHLSCLP